MKSRFRGCAIYTVIQRKALSGFPNTTFAILIFLAVDVYQSEISVFWERKRNKAATADRPRVSSTKLHGCYFSCNAEKFIILQIQPLHSLAI